jgi:hypothetical protein
MKINVFDRFQVSLIQTVPPSSLQDDDDAILAWLTKHKIALKWESPLKAVLYAGEVTLGQIKVDVYTTDSTAEFRAVFSMDDAAYAVLLLQDRLNEQTN